MQQFNFKVIVDQRCLAMMEYKIMMCNKMEWIEKHMRSGCLGMEVVLPCVQSLVYWKAIKGTIAFISKENVQILSIQSLEAHQQAVESMME